VKEIRAALVARRRGVTKGGSKAAGV